VRVLGINVNAWIIIGRTRFVSALHVEERVDEGGIRLEEAGAESDTTKETKHPE
jgi:hypothetical protein